MLLLYVISVVLLIGTLSQGVIGQADKGICSDEGRIRLVGGQTQFEGRVEICLDGVWGTVCDDSWHITASEVVCRQIEIQSGYEILRAINFVSTKVSQADDTQPITLDNVSCTGSEENLLSCDYSRENNCEHREDISVTCVPTDFSLLQKQGAVDGTGTNYDDSPTCYDLTSGLEVTTESADGCIFYPSGADGLCDMFYTLGISTVFVPPERALNDPEILNTVLSQSEEILNHISSPCRETIVRMICYYYFPPCGNVTHFIEPQSVCASTCTNITEVLCYEEWNTVVDEVNEHGLDLLAERFNAHFIDCADPESPFDEAPFCCSNTGLDIDAFITYTLAETQSESEPPLQTIAPVVVLVIMIGVGTSILIVCIVRRRRQKIISRNANKDNIMPLKRQHGDVNGHGLTDSRPLARNTYIKHNDYDGSGVHPPHIAIPGMPEPPLTKVPSEFLQQMSDDKLLIPKRHVNLTQCVGQGEFGIVYRAYLCGWERKDNVVAVKTLRAMFTPKDISDLTKESLKMKSFNHPNVLNLIGVCIDAGEAPYIVMPYMANGSLLAYLKKERPNLSVAKEATEDIVITVQKRLLSICLQIAKGMEYLASQRFVHRDLAARNCMIDTDFVIKVADFGLSEDVYSRNYFRQGNVKDKSESDVKLPIKWMAIESMMDGIFNEKTDLWSYGVTCWEVFSHGRTPYPAVDPFTLIKHLEGGGRLDKPSNAACSDEIFDVMMSCWFDQPHSRPHFSDLVITVNSLLENLAGYMDFSKFQTQQHQGNDST